MLSESQGVRAHRAPKTAYPLLEGFRTVRMKFSKVGSMQYISHLDLQRNFARVLIRAGIPVWYTKGFNPHAKIVFGLPLSVGAQSVCEYVDVRIERDMPCEEIKARMNAEMTEEMQLSEVYLPEGCADFSEISWAEYDIRIFCDGLTDALPDAVQHYLTTSPIMIEKKSKSGVREMDMVPLIRTVAASCELEGAQRVLCLRCTLGACGADYLNPEYVVRALSEKFALMQGDPACEWYEIVRRRVLLADGESEFR
jgi:radical SAM-linked protein